MKIFFIGGGSGGPNAPLVAVAEYIRKVKPETKLVFVSDGKGPAKRMFARFNSPHYTIPAGKWRRYFSFLNLLDIFKIATGVAISLVFLLRQKPKIIFSAGSYVSLPVGIAARLIRIPIVIHQQDLVVARTNKILSKWAKKITVSIEDSTKEFATNVQNKITVTGNPVREAISRGNRDAVLEKLVHDKNLPVILVLGGGTGSAIINKAVTQNLEAITGLGSIIHLTGYGKGESVGEHPSYKQIEFSDNMSDLYAAADLIVSRAGFSVISEISACKKASILIPIPDSPQEENAKYLADKGAAVIIDQKNLAEKLFPTISDLLRDESKRRELAENIGKIMSKDAAEKVGKVILKLT